MSHSKKSRIRYKMTKNPSRSAEVTSNLVFCDQVGEALAAGAVFSAESVCESILFTGQ
jgi:hypothetical protein